MKVLVTGACGQIGSHVVDSLLTIDGVEIIAIDNLETGRISHLPAQVDWLDFHELSVADRSSIFNIIEETNPDVIVHAAASYKDSDDWFKDCEVNAMGTINLIQAAQKYAVKRFVYLQTALCYGNQGSSKNLSVDCSLKPANSSYAITKTAGESFLTISGLDFVSFRLSNIIGARNLNGPLPIFYSRLKRNEQCFITTAERDFVNVRDLTKIIVMACLGRGKGIYNFGSGKKYTIQDLYNSVVEELDITPYPIPEIRSLGSDHIESLLLDSSRTYRDFGVMHFESLKSTVHQAICYYEKYGTNGELSHLKLV
jgi:UDP-glucose 4-epimerase